MACLPIFNSLKIRCDVQRNLWTQFGSLDECLLRNVTVRAPNEGISAVAGYSMNFRSFYIYQSPDCLYFPSGVDNLFPNITILLVTHSGLKFLTTDDLKPFHHIKGLYLNNNQLTSIGSDLFVNNKNLREINLSGNRINSIAITAFDSLSSLQKLDLTMNVCLNKDAYGRIPLEDLKIDIKRKCKYDVQNYPKTILNAPEAVEVKTEIPDQLEVLKGTIRLLEDNLKMLQIKARNTVNGMCALCRQFYNEYGEIDW